MPVNPPAVNKKINPDTQWFKMELEVRDLITVVIQLNTFTPVGTPIITVADVK